MTKFNNIIRVLIVEKLKKGIGQRKTTINLGILRTTVRNIWTCFVATGTVDDKQNPGRPTRYTERDRRKLCIESRRHSFFTAREVRRSAFNTSNMSIWTVRRILRRSGLHRRVASQKPLLNIVQIRKRLSWCKSYLKMDGNLWANVIFSDEARIEFYSRRRQY